MKESNIAPDQDNRGADRGNGTDAADRQDKPSLLENILYHLFGIALTGLWVAGVAACMLWCMR